MNQWRSFHRTTPSIKAPLIHLAAHPHRNGIAGGSGWGAWWAPSRRDGSWTPPAPTTLPQWRAVRPSSWRCGWPPGAFPRPRPPPFALGGGGGVGPPPHHVADNLSFGHLGTPLTRRPPCLEERDSISRRGCFFSPFFLACLFARQILNF